MEKILIVDVDQLTSQLSAEELVKDGYSVTCLTDGFAAMREIAVNLPDLLIVEAILPGISGIELLLKVKASNPELPVLIYTDCEACEDDYLALVADEVLTKSGGTGRLVSAVRKLLARSKRFRFYSAK
ncbi:MAG: response regulator [Planctomycetes bacterium]|nr:response regulator [Planctomycetota bacterium]